MNAISMLQLHLSANSAHLRPSPTAWRAPPSWTSLKLGPELSSERRRHPLKSPHKHLNMPVKPITGVCTTSLHPQHSLTDMCSHRCSAAGWCSTWQSHSVRLNDGLLTSHTLSDKLQNWRQLGTNEHTRPRHINGLLLVVRLPCALRPTPRCLLQQARGPALRGSGAGLGDLGFAEGGAGWAWEGMRARPTSSDGNGGGVKNGASGVMCGLTGLRRGEVVEGRGCVYIKAMGIVKTSKQRGLLSTMSWVCTESPAEDARYAY